MRASIALLFALALPYGQACHQHANTTPAASSAEAVIPASALHQHWRLESLDGSPETRQTQRKPAWIKLGADQKLEGFGGCNVLMAHFTQEDNKLSFGPIASTRRACKSGMRQEGRFIKVLQQVRSWRIHENQLQLLDQTGQIRLRFEAPTP
jgi:heat shock protein HslJ